MARKSLFSRSDGRYLKKIDPFIRFFPYIMKGRNESAVYFKQQVDITELRAWLGKRNREFAATGEGAKSTLFHAILAALIKTVVERPQMNRFVIGRRLYQRNRLNCAFVIKRELKEEAAEEIAIMEFSQDDTLSTISARIQAEVGKVRADARKDEKKRHGALNWFNYLMSTPRILLRGAVSFLGWMDYHGWLPKFIVDADPMHCSLFVSNLASLKIDAPFHHLYEWGTTSVFMTIGVAQKTPVVMPGGDIQARDVVNIAFTLDERIGDGFYYARSIRRFQYMLEHPEELDTPSKPGK